MPYIDDYIDLDKLDWHFYELKVIDTECPREVKEQVDFLKSRLSFDYGTNLYTENPFIPMIVLKDGRRSVDITDLTIEDQKYIECIIENLRHQILLGKLYDILGIVTSDNKYKELAADKFFEYSYGNCTKDNYFTVISAVRRCLFLLHSIKKFIKLKDYVVKIFSQFTFYNDDLEIVIKKEVTKFLNVFKKDLVKDIKDELIALAGKDSEKFEEVQLEIIKVLIDYYKSIKSIDELEVWQIKYAKICKTLSAKYQAYGYKYLQQAIDILDNNKHAKQINELRFLIDESQKKFAEGMNLKTYEIDSDIVSQLNEQCNIMREQFKKLENGARQFIYMLMEFNPVAGEHIKSSLETRRNSLTRHIANEVLFDSEGKIVFEFCSATEEQILEFDLSEIYRMYMPFQHNLVLRPFVDNVKLDDELKIMLKEILSHNVFVPSGRAKIVYDIIENGLNMNIRKALYDLISQFENGCREYLKNYKNLYPEITKGSMTVKIDLNHMIVKKGDKDNPFRDGLMEILGDDLTLQIEYLSCRILSANIRNKFYHYGIEDAEKYSIEEMVLFFLIIKAYCLGCDAELQ